MIKIAHLSDIHLRNNTRHEEYKEVFQNLMFSLVETNPDMIVIAGDLFHQKTELTGNSIVMMTNFLIGLQNVAPVYIIVGNHDYSKQNRDRVDSIEAVVRPLIEGGKKIFYSKNTTTVNFFNEAILYLHSDIDQFKYTNVLHNTINIAVFHGVVDGAKLDNGFELESEIDKSYFDQFDYVLLGDIHKRQKMTDKMYYAGSLIQQDYTEHSFDHGYLLWIIEDKEKFSVTPINILNPYVRIPIRLSKDTSGKIIISDQDIKDFEGRESWNNKCTFVLELDTDFSDEEISEFIKSFKSIGINPAIIEIKREDIFEQLDSKVNVNINENYYDINVQEKVLREYLTEQKVDEGVINEILVLNRDVNSKVKIKEQIIKNQNVEIQSIEIENLFSYKEKQIIDLTGISNSVIGINGKNASGKSSIPDIILWILYGKFSRSSTKSGILNNEATRKGVGSLYFNMNDKKFRIVRTINSKKQGSTSFEYFNGNEWLTYFEVGDTKRDTDKLITKFFGTYDDLVFTNVASQDALTSVIENKKLRKDVINRFLGLDIFGECYVIANKEKNVIANKLDGHLETYKKYNVPEINIKVKELTDKLADQQETIKTLRYQHDTKLKEVADLESKCDVTLIGKNETDIITQLEIIYEKVKHSKEQINAAPGIESLLKTKLKDLNNPDAQITELLGKINDLTGNKRNQVEKDFKDKLLRDKTEQTKELSLQLALIQTDISNFSIQIPDIQKKISELNAKKYGLETKLSTYIAFSKSVNDTVCKGEGEFANCMYLVSAIQYKKQIPEVEKQIQDITVEVVPLEEKLKYNQDKVLHCKTEEASIQLQLSQLIKRIEFEADKEYQTQLSNINTYVTEYNSNLKKLREQQKEYSDIIAKLEQIPLIVESQKKTLELLSIETSNLLDLQAKIVQQKPIFEMIKVAKFQLEGIQKELKELIGVENEIREDIGFHQGLLVTAKEIANQIEIYTNIYDSYKLYLQAYDTDGIPHNLVESVISYLQNKVNSILQMNNVDFKVSIDIDEDKELYLHKVKDGFKIPIDFCSGMEKTIISIAFRVAYSEINSLCKLNLFIIDEAFTTFDSDNIQYIGSIFKYLSKIFNKLMIISHLDSIKEYYDVTLQVEKTKDGSIIERI